MAKKKCRPKAPLPRNTKFARVVASASVTAKPLRTSTGSAESPPPSNSSSARESTSTVENLGTLHESPMASSVAIAQGSDTSPLVSNVVIGAETTQSSVTQLKVDSATYGSTSGAPPIAMTPTVPQESSIPFVPAPIPPPVTTTHETPLNKNTSSELPWATKFKASLHNLKQMSTPIFLEDGMPVVVAPSSVLLKTAEMWKGHIVAQFHGLAPPSGKIFTDLTPIWGRFGDITVRMISETASLIFIPSIATRE